MTKIRICSGYSPSGRVAYGDRFLRSFDKYWPASVELQVYVEEAHKMPRGACRMLWDIPGAREFMDRHSGNLYAQGRKQVEGTRWKQSAIHKGYNFRWDAMKFYKQLIIPRAAAEGLSDGDILVWLDGDVITTSAVPENFIPDLIGDADISYLGRVRSHSEIGYWSVRINEWTCAFLDGIADMYLSDAFLALREWHSAFVHDTVRESMGLKERNLTPNGIGHVWLKSPLYRYTDHLKGEMRKRMGRSV